jgi:hypothetical protein
VNVKEIGCEDVDLIGVADYRDQWRFLVDTAVKLHSPLKGGEFVDEKSDS